MQEISRLQCQIRDHGSSPQKVLRLASLTLQVGRPDQTHEHTLALAASHSGDLNMVREALWLDALAYCLEAAIAEGHCEGGPGVVVKTEKASEYRASARIILERLNKLDDPSPEEVGLLRKVSLGKKLSVVEDYLAGRPATL